ncbi:MAG: glutamine--fructose-6-phosphate transaminase (isomerizing) [Clostridia bacterium]|nr:glutamine--fructose-6-phosphate transaminase (isomerizing) [Clostridia bacterium]
MCGIVGYAGGAQAAPILLHGLKKLEYRGYDSAGIAVRDASSAHIEVIKAKGRLDRLMDMTGGGQAVCGMSGVGHTRWATHGEPSAENAHPHYSREKRVVIVHNGIIENYQEIRDMLERRGYRFHTQTDTEAAALLLDCAYAGEDGNSPQERAVHAIRTTMLRLQGSYALGILFHDQPDVVYAARRDSPLVVGRCTGEAHGHILASDVPAVLSYTRDVVYLDNMEIARITKDTLDIYSIDAERISKPMMHITWDAQAAEKGGYEHFMIKEIHEQPAAVRDTLSPRIVSRNGAPDTDLTETGLTDEEIRRIQRVLFVGCGSAYHAGLVGVGVTEALARIPCSAELASELRYRNAPVQPGTLCVLISQSGETADSLAALRLCKEKGMKTLAIVNVVGSSIAREADAVLYTHAGPEIAVATTKAYSAQLAALYLLAVHLSSRRAAISPAQKQELLEALTALDGKIKQALGEKTRIQRFANTFAACRDVFFIGRGLDHALCMEGSLKLKEISYIHSEAYAAGELKHGAISLIEDGTLVIGAATQPQVFAKMLSGIAEVKSRGACVLALSAQADDRLAEAADFCIGLPGTHPLFAASVGVVPLQLLAYYIACERGLDVDKPRNLAKSVTVE